MPKSDRKRKFQRYTKVFCKPDGKYTPILDWHRFHEWRAPAHEQELFTRHLSPATLPASIPIGLLLMRIQRALISVSDKTGIVDFARELQGAGIEILSTGGTAASLQSEGIPTLEVSSFTGFPEILGGRVKTLHPEDSRRPALLAWRRTTRRTSPDTRSSSNRPCCRQPLSFRGHHCPRGLPAGSHRADRYRRTFDDPQRRQEFSERDRHH